MPNKVMTVDKLPSICTECPTRSTCETICYPMNAIARLGDSKLQEKLVPPDTAYNDQSMRTSLDYKDVLVEMQASILDSSKLMKKIREIGDERIREIASLLAGGFDITEVAKKLKISRDGLYKYLRRHGVSTRSKRAN